MKELETIEKLTDSFSLFPSVGTKTAERMAYAVLEMSDEDIKLLVSNIEQAKSRIHPCPNCGFLTEHEKCIVCSDENRDKSVCLVVGYPKDILSFEKLGSYNGTYHVLNGLINPSKNIGPENLNIDNLAARIKKEGIKELIIATCGTTEGEITALYLAKILSEFNLKITRLAYGIPIGSNFDYVDSLTMAKALKNRIKIGD